MADLTQKQIDALKEKFGNAVEFTTTEALSQTQKHFLDAFAKMEEKDQKIDDILKNKEFLKSEDFTEVNNFFEKIDIKNENNEGLTKEDLKKNLAEAAVLEARADLLASGQEVNEENLKNAIMSNLQANALQLAGTQVIANNTRLSKAELSAKFAAVINSDNRIEITARNALATKASILDRIEQKAKKIKENTGFGKLLTKVENFDKKLGEKYGNWYKMPRKVIVNGGITMAVGALTGPAGLAVYAAIKSSGAIRKSKKAFEQQKAEGRTTAKSFLGYLRSNPKEAFALTASVAGAGISSAIAVGGFGGAINEVVPDGFWNSAVSKTSGVARAAVALSTGVASSVSSYIKSLNESDPQKKKQLKKEAIQQLVVSAGSAFVALTASTALAEAQANFAPEVAVNNEVDAVSGAANPHVVSDPNSPADPVSAEDNPIYHQEPEDALVPDAADMKAMENFANRGPNLLADKLGIELPKGGFRSSALIKMLSETKDPELLAKMSNLSEWDRSQFEAEANAWDKKIGYKGNQATETEKVMAERAEKMGAVTDIAKEDLKLADVKVELNVENAMPVAHVAGADTSKLSEVEQHKADLREEARQIGAREEGGSRKELGAGKRHLINNHLKGGEGEETVTRKEIREEIRAGKAQGKVELIAREDAEEERQAQPKNVSERRISRQEAKVEREVNKLDMLRGTNSSSSVPKVVTPTIVDSKALVDVQQNTK